MTPPKPETQMTEKEYRAHPAQNFSSLSAFYNKGIYSPDHALMKIEFKSYFEYGKMYEAMLQDAVKGTDTFGERFYFTELPNKMPDDLIKWIDNGDDLEQYFEYKKDGGRSATFKGRHAYLDEALKNPGKIPVSKPDCEMLKRHTENMLKMEYLDAKVSDILAAAEWQKPIIFTDYDGIEKKALLDCFVDVGGKFLNPDIKTTADIKRFSYMMRDKYWIQDLLYTDAVNIEYGDCDGMVFFVASKEPPFLCQPMVVDYGGVDFRSQMREEFFELSAAYKKWNDAGRYPKGWLPLDSVKKYPKKES